MTDKAQPFTKEERATVARWAREALEPQSEKRFVGGFFGASRTLRWAITLAQVEAERDALREEVEGAYEAHAEIVAERDAYKRVIEALAVGPGAQDVGGLAIYYRKLSDEADEHFWWEYYGHVADALEALPWPA